MILRLIVLAIIAWMLVIAVVVSFRAKPAGATSIVCVPVKPMDVRNERFKGVQKV